MILERMGGLCAREMESLLCERFRRFRHLAAKRPGCDFPGADAPLFIAGILVRPL